jgi:DNA-binding XRE family transcriptional regulator
MSFPLPLPKPKRESADEVVLARTDWEAIEEWLEQLADLAALDAAAVEDAAYAATLPAGRQATVPLEVIEAKLTGEHPLKAWREHRGLTQQALAQNAGVGRDMIAQIETGKRAGSVATLDRLAAALALPIDALIARG